MFKLNKKVIIITSILLLLILGIGSYFSLKAFGGIEKVINSKKDSGWDILTKNGYKTVICKTDLLNPVNVTITSISGKEQPAFAFYTNLTRDNIFNDFKTNDYQGASGNTTFSETDINKVAKLYEQKGCDFFKQNSSIDSIKFTYNPPLTQTEIQTAEQNNKEEQESLKQREEFNQKPKPQQYAECIQAVQTKLQEYEALKQGKTEFNGIPLLRKKDYEEIVAVKDTFCNAFK